MVEPGSGRTGAMGRDSKVIGWLKAHAPGALYELAELAYSVPAYWKLRAAIKKHQPHFLYERYQSFMLAGRWCKKRTGIPFLSEVNAPLTEEREKHGSLRLRSLAKWCDKQIWTAADHVLPVTEVLATYIRAAGVDNDAITVIPNGANMTLLDAAPTAQRAKEKRGLEGKTVLGFTGFVRDWHGLDRVLPLLKDRPDTALLIVGDGPARQDLEAQAANLGVKDQLQFTGFVEREEIPEYVAAFDVALQPDVVPYASPLKLFDYLGLAKPVVAPDTANIREVLDHGENAILFDAADPQAFARATGELLDDAKAQEALGRAALKTIEAGQYLWTANAARVISLAEKTA